MPKKNGNVGRRAWNLLRLAIIWARKGGVFRRRFLMELRLVPKFIKSLGHSTPRGHLHYGDHELSFDETPVFHVKMNRPASLRFHFPCITPPVDFDYDFDGNDCGGDEVCSYDGGRRSSIQSLGLACVSPSFTKSKQPYPDRITLILKLHKSEVIKDKFNQGT